MKEITYEKWIDTGKELFGKNINEWKFKCPACGKVSKVQDFIDLGQDSELAYKVCIGRVNGKGVSALKGDIHLYGCDWAAFGLFRTLEKGYKIIINDKEIYVFDFAT
jgi:hypothetical protein